MAQNSDILFWRRLVLRQLSTLLEAVPNYTPDKVKHHTDRVERRLLDSGALGPRPTCATASWQSYLTDDHSPIEYSLSIKKDTCTIRFAFEPLSAASGTPVDPVNRIAPTQWLARYESGHDFSWFETLSKHLTVSPSEHPSLSPSACGLSQHIFGYDLVDEPLLKAYIFHDSLGRQTASSPAEWGNQKDELLAHAMEAIGLGTPWGKVATYLANLRASRPELAGQAEFIGWDAVDPKVARMKIYVRFSRVDLPQLLSHLDLAGALDVDKRHTRDIKAAATEMWNVLAREGDGSEIVTDDLQGCDGRTRGVILYYELKQGEEDPIPKFYFPVRHYFSSDLEITRRFDAFLASKGLREPGWYSALLERYCNHRNLDARSGLQTMLGCAVRNGEWELSMYLSAEAYAPERWASVTAVESVKAESEKQSHAPALSSTPQSVTPANGEPLVYLKKLFIMVAHVLNSAKAAIRRAFGFSK